jgi:tRNA nucleotidyltransferase (CCA-adding enzyme)
MSSHPALDHPDVEEMVALLERAVDPGHLALLHLVAEAAFKKGLPLYIIGGFVRDLFVGHPGLDFDLVVEGDAAAFARAIAREYGGKITIHPHFGTASWEPEVEKLALPNVDRSRLTGMPPLDFVTARSETYSHPGALPTVKPGSLADDLCRRDFTINTLALRLDGQFFGQLIDQLGGLPDLKQGLVRALHAESYFDDPTRILRAVRYEKRYNFAILERDLRLIDGAKSHLSGLSGERLRHELDLILAEERSLQMLERLHTLEVLTSLHQLLGWDAQKARLFTALQEGEPDSWQDVPDLLHQPRRVAVSYLLWLGSLGSAQIEDLAFRLDFTASLREALLAYSSLYKDLPSLIDLKPSQVVARLDGTPLLVVCAASLAADPPVRHVLESYLSHWRHVKPQTTGDDLVRRGLPPGPAYKLILGRLREAHLDGKIKTGEEEKTLLETLIRENLTP